MLLCEQTNHPRNQPDGRPRRAARNDKGREAYPDDLVSKDKRIQNWKQVVAGGAIEGSRTAKTPRAGKEEGVKDGESKGKGEDSRDIKKKGPTDKPKFKRNTSGRTKGGGRKAAWGVIRRSQKKRENNTGELGKSD